MRKNREMRKLDRRFRKTKHVAAGTALVAAVIGTGALVNRRRHNAAA